jgi:hypothetical protein
VDTIRKINQEALAYWSRLQAESEKAVLGGGSGHH